jgi:hypothetical protein
MPDRSSAPGRTVDRFTLALEAVIWLILARVVLARHRFSQVADLASRRITPRSASRTTVDHVGWAVNAAARRLPWRASCFARGLAAHLMLRDKGHGSTLCFGARNDRAAGPSAHVWVQARGRFVVGGDECEHFALLASFSSEPASQSS